MPKLIKVFVIGLILFCFIFIFYLVITKEVAVITKKTVGTIDLLLRDFDASVTGDFLSGGASITNEDKKGHHGLLKIPPEDINQDFSTFWSAQFTCPQKERFIIEADLFIDGLCSDPYGQQNILNISNTPHGGTWSGPHIAVRNKNHLYAYTDHWVDLGIALMPERWYHLKCEVDMDENHYQVYLNGEKIASELGFITSLKPPEVAWLKCMPMTSSVPTIYFDRIKVWTTQYLSPELGTIITPNPETLLKMNPGWDVQLIARLPESHTWTIATGDADNDGKQDLVVGSSPESELWLLTYNGSWRKHCLMRQLTGCRIGITSEVLIVDTDNDGLNEVFAATGHDALGKPRLHHLSLTKDGKIRYHRVYNPLGLKSTYTHGLAWLNTPDLKGILSAYCGFGELVCFKKEKDSYSPTLLEQFQASGEGVIVTDLDGDNITEVVAFEGYQNACAKAHIYRIDSNNRLKRWFTIEEDNKFFFVYGINADLNGDGNQELICDWVSQLNPGEVLTDLIVYAFDTKGIQTKWILEHKSTTFEVFFPGKQMASGDLDADGKEKVIITDLTDCTISLIKWNDDKPTLDKIGYLQRGNLSHLCLAIGDVDANGKPEIYLGTGFGQRTCDGECFIYQIIPPRKR